MIKFRCSHCNKLLGGEDKQAGLMVTCPKCKEKTRIPKPGEAPPKKVETLEVVEEEEFEIVEDLEVIEEPAEVDLAAFEAEEARTRKKPRRASDEEEDRPRKRPRRPVDEDEEEEEERPRRKPIRDYDHDDEEDVDRPRKRPRRPINEDEDEDEEDEDRPRRRSERDRRRGRLREQAPSGMSRNRIMGLLGIICGIFGLAGGGVSFLIFDGLYFPIMGLVLGALFLIAGVIYAIIG